MIKRLLSSLFLFVFFLVFVPGASAEGEFASSYNVLYNVDESGVTSVNEQITLRNLTEKFYASSYTLSIGASKIFDVSASDSSGPLESTVNQEGSRSVINVKFSQQLVGQNKEYNWNLKFKSRDFAEKQGKIWQVSVPRISSKLDLDKYALILSVPAGFGEPSSIIPEPVFQSETNGRINLSFSKDQLLQSGILANFGKEQDFVFKMTYKLVNNNVLPVVAKVPLPANTQYQQVIINSINPKPESVKVDGDGNYIALFKVPKNETLEVDIDGQVQLYLESIQKNKARLSKQEEDTFLQTQKYWETDNPAIKQKLDEIFRAGVPESVQEKERLINQFVVDTLIYDSKRLAKGEFSRLGAVTALANPSSALCSEFADLFVALSRAAGVPAREVVGYAYTSNQQLRPLSFDSDVLHAWAEYYDPAKGWVMVDPTWQNTTGGVDYFSKFDLNHFALAVRGVSSEEPVPADQVDVEFSKVEFKPVNNLVVSVQIPNEIYAGFPAKGMITVENKGNSVGLPISLSLRAAKLNLNFSDQTTPELPPFAKVEYPFELRSALFSNTYSDQLILSADSKLTSYQVDIKSFFSLKYIPIAVGLIVALIVGIYLSVLGFHLISKQSSLKIPKKIAEGGK